MTYQAPVVSRASLYRCQTDLTAPWVALQRALDPEERQYVLDLLHVPRFIDLVSAEIYATLLDEGVYYCSIRIMYRILAEHDKVRERRR